MNPYEVLGVSEDADEETIKKAYRELVKKYHPDKYVNNPLADLAAEKMKEINKAYDMLTNGGAKNAGHGGRSGGYGSAGGAGGSYEQASFANVRTLIAQSRLREALSMLEALPRNAEWYYLSGRIRIMAGWYEQGISFLQTAVNMEPENEEYRAAYENVKNRTQTYRTDTGGGLNIGCCGGDCCAVCTTCACLECCCR